MKFTSKLSSWWSRATLPIVHFFVPQIFFEVKKIAESIPTLAAEIPILKKLSKPAMLWMMLSEAALVAQIYPVKLAMDAWNSGQNIWQLMSWCALISFVFVLGGYINYRMSCARNAFSDYLGQVVLWGEAHRKQLSLDAAWHVEHGTGEKESKIMRNSERAQVFFESFIFDSLKIKFRIVFTGIGMLIIMPPFGILACVVFALYVKVLKGMEPQLAPLSEEYHADLQMLNEFGSQLTQNVLTIKSLGKETYFADLNRKKLMECHEREVKRHKIWRALIAKPDQVVNVSKGSIYALGFIMSRMGLPLTLGSFVLAINWMERIFSNMYNLVEFQEKSRRGIPAIKELVEIFSIIPAVKSPEKPVWKDSWQGGVEFQNVEFAYGQQAGQTLNGINLKIAPNSLVGIVGKTGCGKSTLLKLLRREYDPDSGVILVDGIDIRQIDFDKYRQKVIGVVQQDIQLFEETLRYNIRLSNLDAPDGQELVAAKQAYAEEFILKRPGGYESMLGEDGKQLSGGQRQRLGLARALHGRPRILILDEPTSSLDSESQLHVQQALDDLMERKFCTTFIIAHRFSTVHKADIIVVMDEGKIVEVGTHEQLVEMNGFYKRLHELDQQGGFANEEVTV